MLKCQEPILNNFMTEHHFNQTKSTGSFSFECACKEKCSPSLFPFFAALAQHSGSQGNLNVCIVGSESRGSAGCRNTNRSLDVPQSQLVTVQEALPGALRGPSGVFEERNTTGEEKDVMKGCRQIKVKVTVTRLPFYILLFHAREEYEWVEGCT